MTSKNAFGTAGVLVEWCSVPSKSKDKIAEGADGRGSVFMRQRTPPQSRKKMRGTIKKWIARRRRSNQQCDLLAGAVHALDEDALDVGSFRRACAPNDVRAVAKCSDPIWNAAMDLRTLKHGDMHPR